MEKGAISKGLIRRIQCYVVDMTLDAPKISYQVCSLFKRCPCMKWNWGKERREAADASAAIVWLVRYLFQFALIFETKNSVCRLLCTLWQWMMKLDQRSRPTCSNWISRRLMIALEDFQSLFSTFSMQGGRGLSVGPRILSDFASNYHLTRKVNRGSGKTRVP